MSQDWISSKQGVLVYGLTRSDQPAWVWSANGDATLWHNQAARWFQARQKNGTARPASPARPIKGQVKRLLRLGFAGVTSLARVQMLVDGHPVSQTCRCTPIVLADGEQALVCVSADAIAVDDFLQSSLDVPAVDHLLPHLGAYALLDENDHMFSGSPEGIVAVGDSGVGEARRERLDDGLSFLVFAEGEAAVAAEAASTKNDEPEALTSDDGPDEPIIEAPVSGRLTDLMERFDTESTLYEPLGPEDDEVPAGLDLSGETQTEDEFIAGAPYGPEDAEVDPADVAELALMDGSGEDFAEGDDEEVEPVETLPQVDESAKAPVQWRVTGRDFVADAEVSSAPDDTIEAEAPEELTDEPPDEELDQAARYNFDELARILSDRVAGETQNAPVATISAPTERRTNKQTLSLSDEHLVLNRLPLGILVFRDQDIVFANRAMADLLACASIAQLRERGLEAIFPRVGDPNVHPGPVATLLDSQGMQVPVSARLQAVTWHGGPALMLSARREDAAPSGEILVRNFVETLAASRGDGFVEVSRAGVIEAASGRATDLLAHSADGVIGRPLALFVAPTDIPELRAFLEKPARRAGLDRPSLSVETTSDVELTLFTEGSAGIVTGYFGMVADPVAIGDISKVGTSAPSERDPALMAKMSRGLRRPLNTIIGFSQLLENQAFGPLGHARYLEYARDIQSSGREIEGLIDELDQIDGLQNEGFLADASEFALADLLSECEGVVRVQASRRQVFVRSAISEHLPLIRADRTLMRQALLNLLASAIDQTPQGGKVILSAQVEDDGTVSVHVRDSGKGEAELSERFAVFREGSARHGEAMVPMKSSIGLALTRSLLAVNACKLTIDPTSGIGTVMSLHIPADLTRAQQRQAD